MDAVMLEDILGHIHNWFVRDSIEVRTCCIDDGRLPASITDRMFEGQWYRIQGSYLNDGLHRHPDYDLSDETFDGVISLLAIPRPLLRLSDEISQWRADTAEADQKTRKAPYQSESFGGYTYSLKGDSRANSSSGGLTGWQAAFASDLNQYRKIS